MVVLTMKCRHPAPFECQFKLRSPEKAKLLMDEEAAGVVS